MDLLEELSAFDGRRTDTLESLAGRLKADATLVDDLRALAGHEDANIQSAATWLLKRFQEDGTLFSPEQTGGLLDLLATVTSWDARLHLLQMLPRFGIATTRTAALMQVLKSDAYLEAPNTFVRAWAYGGLAECAEKNAALREEAATLLSAGEGDAVGQSGRASATSSRISPGSGWRRSRVGKTYRIAARCFETAASRPPQHEGVADCDKSNTLMLRSTRRVRLEVYGRRPSKPRSSPRPIRPVAGTCPSGRRRPGRPSRRAAPGRRHPAELGFPRR